MTALVILGQSFLLSHHGQEGLPPVRKIKIHHSAGHGLAGCPSNLDAWLVVTLVWGSWLLLVIDLTLTLTREPAQQSLSSVQCPVTLTEAACFSKKTVQRGGETLSHARVPCRGQG